MCLMALMDELVPLECLKFLPVTLVRAHKKIGVEPVPKPTISRLEPIVQHAGYAWFIVHESVFQGFQRYEAKYITGWWDYCLNYGLS